MARRQIGFGALLRRRIAHVATRYECQPDLAERAAEEAARRRTEARRAFPVGCRNQSDAQS